MKKVRQRPRQITGQRAKQLPVCEERGRLEDPVVVGGGSRPPVLRGFTRNGNRRGLAVQYGNS